MNASELNLYSTLPVRYSKHQGVFGKYAATEAALENGWPGEGAFVPATPITPSMDIPHGMASVKSELLTPDSLQTISPDELLTADNSPLFDDIDINEMQNWESLFLDEEAQTEAQPMDRRMEQQRMQPGVDLSMSALSAASTGVSEAAPKPVSEPFPVGGDELPESLDFSVLDQLELPSNSVKAEIADKQPRRRSVSKSPSGGVTKSYGSRKIDDLGITVYQRKPRSTPLKPVEVPEDADDMLAKRAKNTEAARRSRARKLERMSQLEERVRELLDENEALRAEIAQLKGM